MSLIFDIETDGLLDTMTKVHCVGIWDTETQEYTEYVGEAAVDNARETLRNASVICGHNVVGFDLPALGIVPNGLVRDTLILARLMFPHIADKDYLSDRVPGKLIGSHSLEAWGHRLGVHKIEGPKDWKYCTPEMLTYMKQDVMVTVRLWEMLCSEAYEWDVPIYDSNPPPGKDCIQLEHDIAQMCFEIEQHGWAFDMATATDLTAKLTVRQQELEHELHKVFGPETIRTPFVPKANNKKLGYVKGVPTEKVKVVPFNPGSRHHVGKRLKALGWKPEEFNKDGTPRVDDDILSALPYPEAKLLAEYFTVQKRLGQVANGNHSWFRHAVGNLGAVRIHGRYQSGGAHTGRATHSSPNIAQVPASYTPYGKECRSCFIADTGQVLVGCDADGLEQRTLGGYAAAFDGGDYIKSILNGRKEDGTDLHSINARLIGCDRDTAKVFFYALIYGAGNRKLGQIIGKSVAAGKAARDRLMKGVPGLGRLTNAVQQRWSDRGYLIGLDGRRLYPRTKNAALNTLLQGAGAIVMKRALANLSKYLTQHSDCHLVGWIHDEIQASVPEEKAEEYGKEAVRAIERAGEFYEFPCPLTGQYQVGRSWAETH